MLLLPYEQTSMMFANGILILQANILSLEEKIIDATTEEGRQQLKDLEAAAAEETAADGETTYAHDPE
jgi:Cdc37 C terminal domain